MNELDTNKDWIILSIKDSLIVMKMKNFEAISVTKAIGVYQTGIFFGIPVYKSPHINFNIACLNGKKTYFRFKDYGPIV